VSPCGPIAHEPTPRKARNGLKRDGGRCVWRRSNAVGCEAVSSVESALAVSIIIQIHYGAAGLACWQSCQLAAVRVSGGLVAGKSSALLAGDSPDAFGAAQNPFRVLPAGGARASVSIRS